MLHGVCTSLRPTTTHRQAGTHAAGLILPIPALCMSWMHPPSHGRACRAVYRSKQAAPQLGSGLLVHRQSKGRHISKFGTQISASAAQSTVPSVSGAAVGVCQALEVLALLAATCSTVQLIAVTHAAHQQHVRAHEHTGASQAPTHGGSSTASVSARPAQSVHTQAPAAWVGARLEPWVQVCPQVVSTGSHWIILQVLSVCCMLVARAAGKLVRSVSRWLQEQARAQPPAGSSLSEQASLAAISAAHAAQGNRLTDLERQMSKVQLASRVYRQDVMKPLHQVQSGMSQQSQLVAQLSKAVEKLHQEVLDTQKLLVASQSTSAKQFHVMVKAFESVQQEQAALRDRANKAAAIIQLLQQQRQQQGAGVLPRTYAPGSSGGQPVKADPVPDPWQPKQPVPPYPNSSSNATRQSEGPRRRAAQQDTTGSGGGGGGGSSTSSRASGSGPPVSQQSTATSGVAAAVSVTAGAVSAAGQVTAGSEHPSHAHADGAPGPSQDHPLNGSSVAAPPTDAAVLEAARNVMQHDDSAGASPVTDVQAEHREAAQTSAPPAASEPPAVHTTPSEGEPVTVQQANGTAEDEATGGKAEGRESSPVAWEAWTDKGRLMAWTYRGDPC